ncbi:MAG: (2Fe-2S)-binding protein [Planctomycetaceae bacterium]|nr:(2Fe-2S)-binding protein [Planctomycetaceae bacterium]
MSMATIKVNGQQRDVSGIPADTPLLWVLRDHLGLTGTKYGCGVSECGACTVHIDGEAAQSCVTAISDIGDASVVTIEGLSENGDHPVQQAWKAHNVPQCGYCQVGQMMTCAAMLAANPNPNDDEINDGMWNICRCGTYNRIRDAVKTAAKEMR